MTIINIQHLTKDYGNNKGIFDVSLKIEKGEVFGFLGPNGAGKTTTIRHLLGFIKPQSGKATILNLDCWNQPKEIQKHLGYLPAEIAFPENMTGTQLILHAAKMRGLGDMTKANQLIEMFDLDPSTQIKRMSKGMKQKVGIVCAFMHDPQILILDEPTTGLDPLMQSMFVKLIHQEKNKGKSILMSSHLFEEIEGTCDSIAMIKQGKIISVMNSQDFKHFSKNTFIIMFKKRSDFESILKENFVIKKNDMETLQVTVEIEDKQINELIRSLSKREVTMFREMKNSLEDHFMSFYKGENQEHV
ncbi:MULTISPECIES: ABC transporter ATP-binding protein [Bacillaceae]|uniref:ABC transporter ATP-binding protein n=1 Tax=Gottfriedia luciferensis TaxID=178774 RepID=A0ABX2ZVU1_9BACI|nr:MULTISPECIES: ABC transporter ATP-binding protein [Bacillaceae]ODG93532.1 ABC transporter ATP-binding protein [Gottfriedia luciferensis]PGZ93449.1 ABC transporter ATP-binding protein [Bacillus sp. AFS029533]SFC43298.1 ABC-2 type transport system ATP-binding protein [Bacillus sp. UNCCL81]